MKYGESNQSMGKPTASPDAVKIIAERLGRPRKGRDERQGNSGGQGVCPAHIAVSGELFRDRQFVMDRVRALNRPRDPDRLAGRGGLSRVDGLGRG